MRYRDTFWSRLFYSLAICGVLTIGVGAWAADDSPKSVPGQVLVRFSSADARWNLVIEDDGRGFPFSGRLSQAELEAMGKGPLVIKERIRLIEGELTIESNPGRGSRLEIRVPHKREAAYG